MTLVNLLASIQRELTEALGSTFFDPGNLLSILFLSISALLSISELSSVVLGAAGLQARTCVWLLSPETISFTTIAIGRILLVIFWAVATGFILVGAWYWDDCAQDSITRGIMGLRQKSKRSFYVGGILHVMTAATLTIHFLVPRRWLSRMADDLSDNFQEVVADEVEENQGRGL